MRRIIKKILQRKCFTWHGTHMLVISHWTKARASFAIFGCLREFLFPIFVCFFLFWLVLHSSSHWFYPKIVIYVFSLKMLKIIIRFEIAKQREHSWNEFFLRNLSNQIHSKKKNDFAFSLLSVFVTTSNEIQNMP